MSKKAFSVVRKHAKRDLVGSQKDRTGRVHRAMAIAASEERFQADVGYDLMTGAEVFEFAREGMGTEFRRQYMVNGVWCWKRIESLPPLSLDQLPMLEGGLAEAERAADEWSKRIRDHYEADFKFMENLEPLSITKMLPEQVEEVVYVPECAWNAFFGVQAAA